MSAITPALVLAARRGFTHAYVGVGKGTFQDDEYDRAENFFDDQADDGNWSDGFYRAYADLDPWRQDKDGNYGDASD